MRLDDSTAGISNEYKVKYVYALPRMKMPIQIKIRHQYTNEVKKKTYVDS